MNLICSLVALPFLLACQEQEPEVSLAEEPHSVVLSLDVVGGFAPPRSDTSPLIEIQRDGTVLLGDPMGRARPTERRIDEAELRELVRLAVETHDLFAFDQKAALAAVSAAQEGGGMAVADAPDTVVVVALKDRRVEARFNALPIHADMYPDIKGLRDLHVVAERLENLRNILLVGGRERVDELLALANEELGRKHPGTAPLKPIDLREVETSDRGATILRLYRPEGRGHVEAEIEQAEGGEPVISVNLFRPPR